MADAQLWMGDLDPYMDESFISNAFSQMGEPIKGVKIIKNRLTGYPAGYCFVEFSDGEMAHHAMLKLNGKSVPNSQPPKRFKLNTSLRDGKSGAPTNEFSLFVGDLSEEVDDYALYYGFAKKYRSCRSAKVVLEANGKSKGYGFVRFGEEIDQQKALIEMQNSTGLGKKQIRVSLATPKRHYDSFNRPLAPDMMGGGVHWSHYYGHNYPYSTSYYNYYNQAAAYDMSYMNNQQVTTNQEYVTQEDEADALEDPELEIDVAKYNKEFMEQSEDLYDEMELSRWTPLDNITSKIPTASTT